MIALRLDDPAAIRKIDPSDMLSAIQRTPYRFLPPNDAESTCHIEIDQPTKILFAGLGGSAIAGDIMADYCRDIVGVPVTVCRSVKLPDFVDKRTFVVTISYSGDTRETLSMFQQAKDNQAHVAVVASGGKLLGVARTRSIPYLNVAPNMPPRVALPELVAALVHMLAMTGMVDKSRKLLESASASTRTLIESTKVTVPMKDNPAKQIASCLHGHLPVLIGSEENVSVLRRFKNELNENSKMPAVYYTLPEAYHNDIEGLKTLNALSNPQPVILRSPSQETNERLEANKLSETLSEFGYSSPLFFDGIGNERFGWLLSAITLGDFVSFYLAILNGVDPSPLLLIPNFKSIKGLV
jgi:glucose/mannose-6-phosphate isomerase